MTNSKKAAGGQPSAPVDQEEAKLKFDGQAREIDRLTLRISKLQAELASYQGREKGSPLILETQDPRPRPVGTSTVRLHKQT
mmetsp:Transcript_40205/g.61372  ORF Transcript_40205/g.61372 Transcript_40205/m.61372 type:complete len:82 (+) Transcript_40205:178-423(+)